MPEICEFRRRKVQALERTIVLLNYAEKSVAEVVFQQSIEGVSGLACRPEE